MDSVSHTRRWVRKEEDRKMASSSSNPHVTLEVEEEYPYPSNLSAASFISIKLSGKDKYHVWKTQMLCLLKAHGMFGFIDGTFASPNSWKEKVGDDHNHYWLWTRSDSVVKGWILGSLVEETVVYVLNRLSEKHGDEDFTAKHVWDELQAIYAPPVLPQLLVEGVDHQEEVRARLYEATLHGNWDEVDRILNQGVTVTDKIANNGNTTLHVVVGSTNKPEVIEKLLGLMPENTQLLDVRNLNGSTLLHTAAIVGNTKAARVLVERDQNLLLAKDDESHTPLLVALSNMHIETAQLLLQHINTDRENDTLFSGTSGDELLVTLISSKHFRLALDLLGRYKTLHSDVVLMAIAQNFPAKPDTFDKIISNVKIIHHVQRHFCVQPSIEERVQIRKDAKKMLWEVVKIIRNQNGPRSHQHYYTNPILEATRQNAYEVVKAIVRYFPNAIWSLDDEGHNIIQYAVTSRSEKVYNLLHRMSEQIDVYRTKKDSSGNNLLHLAARIAPANRLISRPAFNIQRELQWFQEVKTFVCPLNIQQKNSYGETPQMTFSREHTNLVIEGEKWIKAAAESYTITAALITTVVFAAAITVPGGNNQDTGIPISINNDAFRVFAISDAISLFTAVTSLLMFLSILTSSFAEQDFLYKLPTKLIIGLVALFISTTAMIVAFAASLYIVFGKSTSRTLIPVACLTCLPITSFVTLQFPLVIDLMNATYCRSIFGKMRVRPCY